MAVALDGEEGLYIADTGNNRIRRVDFKSGVITTVAGDGGFGGPDRVPATRTGLWRPVAIAVDNVGNLIIAESTFELVRKVDRYTAIMSTVAGFPTAGIAEDGYRVADGGPSLAGVYGIATDVHGNLILADARNNRICMLDQSSRMFSVLAGNSIPGFTGDDKPAAGASLSFPEGVSLDKIGNVFIADTGNNRIRRIDAKTGILSTVAGDGKAAYGGDGSLAINASLCGPTAITVDSQGDLIIADTGNDRIRRVDGKTRIIVTVVDGQR